MMFQRLQVAFEVTPQVSFLDWEAGILTQEILMSTVRAGKNSQATVENNSRAKNFVVVARGKTFPAVMREKCKSPRHGRVRKSAEGRESQKILNFIPSHTQVSACGRE